MTERSILITGCSSGIGYHAAHALANRGWRVLATCRSEDDCARLLDEGLESFPLDYQVTESIRTGFATAMELTEGRLDALFNNGAYGMVGAIEDIPTDAWREIFEANFFGWHELTRLVLPIMRQQKFGRIVQCSSVLGFIGVRMRAPYIATKFALEGYTDTLRLELIDTDIRPILIEPGPIATKFRVNIQPHFERWVDTEKSHWSDFYRSTVQPRLYSTDGKKDRFELKCEATTAKLIHALESPRPRARYYVTTPTYIAAYLKCFLPTRWMDRVLLKG